MAQQDPYDLLIVGDGCMGASTALHAVKKMPPKSRIILFGGRRKRTASRDVNKIIRTTYPDQDYVALAEEALERWNEDEFYSKYFHRCSWIQVTTEGSYRSTKVLPSDQQIQSIEELREIVGFSEAPKFDPGEELWLNKNVGYVDSSLALEAVLREAASLGVEWVEKDIVKVLRYEGTYRVEVEDGSTVWAKKVVVAAGPWTVQLLQKSGISIPSDFFTVASVSVAELQLLPDEWALASIPILVTERGEVIPSAETKVLKITTTKTFRIEDPELLKASHHNPDTSTNHAVLAKVLPQFSKRELDSWSCCDLITPNQHPLIAEVPEMQGLYLATAGSYHAFKFFTLLGELVFECIQGYSSPPLHQRVLSKMGWDRPMDTISIHKSIVPEN